jgi:hypothetical protein
VQISVLFAGNYLMGCKTQFEHLWFVGYLQSQQLLEQVWSVSQGTVHYLIVLLIQLDS